MMEKIQSREKEHRDGGEVLESAAKICYLCLAICTFNSFIYVSPVQPVLVKITIILCSLLILFRLTQYKKYFRMPAVTLLIAFCFSFLLSTVMNRQYGIIENGKWIIWTGIQFFALYVCDVSRNIERYKKEFRIAAHIIIIYSIVAAIISLIMMGISYSGIIVTADEEYILSGFLWGRLWGVYTDPNYGAVFGVISLLLSVFFCIQKKKKKIIYIISIALNFLYLVFSDSRTGEIALVFSMGLFVYMILFQKLKGKKTVVKFGASFLIVLCMALGILGGIRLVKVEYNRYLAPIVVRVFQKESQKEELYKEKSQIGRKKDIEKDVSNGRFDLWKSGIEVWKSAPVYGSGYATFVEYAKDHTSYTYAIHNELGDYSSLHNEFINILVFQGGIGLAIFLSMAGMLIVYTIPILYRTTGEEYQYFCVLLSCVGAVGVSMFFLLEGIYTISPGSFILWVFVGYMVQYAWRLRNEGKV